ncbi:hypothetical protein JHK82_023721 [Glycine max]|nr:hypothetical protein JHK82_023721 [Glycine max]
MSFRIRDQERGTDSPREAGEIDTRAPFQSVKAAVSLFGEVAVSKEKHSIKRRSSENVLEKETQLLLAQRELNKIKKQLESEAQRSAKLNSEKLHELKNQIATMKEQIEHLKLASSQAQEDQAKIMREREARQSFYENAKEEAQNKLITLKNEYEPELTQSLEAKLAETSEEIQVLQEQMKEAHASEMDSVRRITLEIKEATKTLQEVAEEETSLRNLVDSLSTELEQVKKEQEELKEKEKAAEALAVDLTDQLQSKPGDTMEKESDKIDEIELKIKHLSFETETARREEEEMRSKTQELKQEAEKSKAVAEELEKKLELYLKQAEGAKASEQRAIEEMKMMSDSDNNTQDTVSVADSNGKIVLTVDEFAALSGKIKESEDMIDRTETAAMAQVEAINTRRNEVDRKVEANLKAIEEIKAATDMALRNAEMADSAKVAVEGELRKWRQEEQNMDYSDNSSRPISLRI